MKIAVALLGALLTSQVSYAVPVITSDGYVTAMSHNRGVLVLLNDPPASEQIFENIDQTATQRNTTLLSGAQSEIRRGDSIQCGRITLGESIGNACEFRITPLGEIIHTSGITGLNRTTPFGNASPNAQVYSSPLSDRHEDGVGVTISGTGAGLIYDALTEVRHSIVHSQRASGADRHTGLQLEKSGRDLTCIKTQSSASTDAQYKCSFHLDTTGTAHRDD